MYKKNAISTTSNCNKESGSADRNKKSVNYTKTRSTKKRHEQRHSYTISTPQSERRALLGARGSETWSRRVASRASLLATNPARTAALRIASQHADHEIRAGNLDEKTASIFCMCFVWDQAARQQLQRAPHTYTRSHLIAQETERALRCST